MQLKHRPQEDHADLGIVDDDATEDLRPQISEAPGVAAPRASEPTTHRLMKGSSMPTITPPTDPPVPPGAEPDQWVGGQRDVYAQVGYIATSADLLECPSVTLFAEQRANGHLGRIDIMLDVAMGRSDAGLSATQARELAGLLIQAADLGDRWAGSEQTATPVELLANAFSALRVAHDALRTAPGNAGDYVHAALDSISDAAEALK